MPEVIITNIKFDERDGTELKRNGDNWSVKTPPHEEGAVDIVVEWTLGGIKQNSIIYEKGFIYDSSISPNPGNPSTPSTPSNPSSPSTPSTPSKPEPSADFMIPELEEETLEKLEDMEQGKNYTIEGTEEACLLLCHQRRNMLPRIRPQNDSPT